MNIDDSFLGQWSLIPKFDPKQQGQRKAIKSGGAER